MKLLILLVPFILLTSLYPPPVKADIDISIATISYSIHRDACGQDCQYNEKHGGLFLGINGWVVGEFKNSYGNRSVAVGHEWKLGTWQDLEFSGALLLANHYREDDNSRGDYLLIPTLSMDFPIIGNLKIRTSYAVVVAFIGLKYDF